MYNKYRVSTKEQRTIYGIVFSSKKEANRYLILKDREKRNEISDLQRQVKFTLQEKFIYAGKKYREINYFADFSYWDKKLNCTVYEDAKGYRTQTYQIKKKLLLKKYPDIVFIET